MQKSQKKVVHMRARYHFLCNKTNTSTSINFAEISMLSSTDHLGECGAVQGLPKLGNCFEHENDIMVHDKPYIYDDIY